MTDQFPSTGLALRNDAEADNLVVSEDPTKDTVEPKPEAGRLSHDMTLHQRQEQKNPTVEYRQEKGTKGGIDDVEWGRESPSGEHPSTTCLDQGRVVPSPRQDTVSREVSREAECSQSNPSEVSTPRQELEDSRERDSEMQVERENAKESAGAPCPVGPLLAIQVAQRPKEESLTSSREKIIDSSGREVASRQPEVNTVDTISSLKDPLSPESKPTTLDQTRISSHESAIEEPPAKHVMKDMSLPLQRDDEEEIQRAQEQERKEDAQLMEQSRDQPTPTPPQSASAVMEESPSVKSDNMDVDKVNNKTPVEPKPGASVDAAGLHPVQEIRMVTKRREFPSQDRMDGVTAENIKTLKTGINLQVAAPPKWLEAVDLHVSPKTSEEESLSDHPQPKTDETEGQKPTSLRSLQHRHHAAISMMTSNSMDESTTTRDTASSTTSTSKTVRIGHHRPKSSEPRRNSERSFRTEPGQEFHRPRHNDVVFGWGNGVKRHPGNILFKEVIWKYQTEYDRVGRGHKGRWASRVIDQIKRLDPPGRFLVQGQDGRYREAPYEQIVDLAGRILRRMRKAAADDMASPPPRGMSGGNVEYRRMMQRMHQVESSRRASDPSDSMARKRYRDEQYRRYYGRDYPEESQAYMMRQEEMRHIIRKRDRSEYYRDELERQELKRVRSEDIRYHQRHAASFPVARRPAQEDFVEHYSSEYGRKDFPRDYLASQEGPSFHARYSRRREISMHRRHHSEHDDARMDAAVAMTRGFAIARANVPRPMNADLPHDDSLASAGLRSTESTRPNPTLPHDGSMSSTEAKKSPGSDHVQGMRRQAGLPHEDSMASEPDDSKPVFTTSTPQYYDVLSGRGSGVNKHSGNVLFRGLIRENRDYYAQLSKTYKPKFALHIVRYIQNLSPSGRFLKRESDGMFREVSEKTAVEKVCQAFRETRWRSRTAENSSGGLNLPQGSEDDEANDETLIEERGIRRLRSVEYEERESLESDHRTSAPPLSPRMRGYGPRDPSAITYRRPSMDMMGPPGRSASADEAFERQMGGQRSESMDDPRLQRPASGAFLSTYQDVDDIDDINLGSKLLVYWSKANRWYSATVEDRPDWNRGRAWVRYDSGDFQEPLQCLDLCESRIKMKKE